MVVSIYNVPKKKTTTLIINRSIEQENKNLLISIMNRVYIFLSIKILIPKKKDNISSLTSFLFFFFFLSNIYPPKMIQIYIYITLPRWKEGWKDGKEKEKRKR